MKTCGMRRFLAVLLVALLGSCTNAPNDCPECPAAELRDAPAKCREVSLQCADGGPAVGRAEICAYYDDLEACFVQQGEQRIACGRCDQCDAVLARLEGSSCAVAVNACAASPCRNDGVCTATDSGFTCACKQGFTGATCANDVDECATNPNACSAGQTCRNTLGGYACTCPVGYQGAGCTQDVNECALGVCQNGGSCENLVGSYRCSCPAGVSGDTCEIDARVCRGTPSTCAGRSQSLCTTATLGCNWAVRPCVGTATPCSSYYSSYTCDPVDYCYWSTYYRECSGSVLPCGSRSNAACAGGGCSVGSDRCVGSPSPCSSFTRETCGTQPGCGLVAP